MLRLMNMTDCRWDEERFRDGEDVADFLQKQGLLEYVEQDEMIKTTKKLDNFMDWNLLNQNNYNRVLRVLGVTENE